MATTLTIEMTDLHPAQRKVLRKTRRFNVVACGRRWGKTTLGAERLIDPALDGRPVAWFSPTYKMLAEPWRYVKRVVAPITARSNEQDHRLELITGGVIDFWSLEKFDSVRGRKYQRVVVDEAAMVKDMSEAWDAAIRPTLTDYRGSADFFSTPKGRNFFWQAFTRGQDKDEKDWASWQMPTTANPLIDPSEVDDARRQLPERVFRQEYLAEFLDDAGGVFRKVTESVDRGRSLNTDPEPSRTYNLGVDLARVEDFTVLTVIDHTGRQVYHERFNRISWERQINAIMAVATKYNALTYVDSTGVGDPIYQQLAATGLNVRPYQLTSKSKSQLIDNLAVLIEQSRLRLLDLPVQTNELQAYAYEVTPSRNVRMSAPSGMHDDCVIALALAAWPLRHESSYVEVPAVEVPTINESDWRSVDNPHWWS